MARSKIYEKLSLFTNALSFSLAFSLCRCTSENNIHLKCIQMLGCSGACVCDSGVSSYQFNSATNDYRKNFCLFACITKIVIVEPNSSFCGNDDPNSHRLCYSHWCSFFCIHKTNTCKTLSCIKSIMNDLHFSRLLYLMLSHCIGCIKLTLNSTANAFCEIEEINTIETTMKCTHKICPCNQLTWNKSDEKRNYQTYSWQTKVSALLFFYYYWSAPTTIYCLNAMTSSKCNNFFQRK